MNKHLYVSDISFPSDLSLHQLFKHQAEQRPNHIALVYKGRTMSFKELDQQSDEVASRLLQLGIQQEEFVALYLERSFELIVGIFGVLKAGGAYVPIDVDYPKDRMAFMVEDAQAKIILTQKHLQNNLPQTSATTICLGENLLSENIPIPNVPISSSQLAYMIYTSGSTGRPKGVMITHENVCNQLEGQQAIAPEPIATMMLTCSISFDVSVLTIFWTLLQGATLVIPEQGEEKDMVQLAGTIYDQQVTHILTLPSLYTLLLEQASEKKLQSLKLVNVSGEVCPVSLAQKHEEVVPNGQLYNLYGPTEATVNCTYFTFPKGFKEAKAPIGIPIKNYEIFILDENLLEVPKGEIGEIYIGGSKPVVGRGYWNRPELTAERFIDSSKLTTQNPTTHNSKLYKTGDLARWMPDGNIEFLGRADFQVKYRGYRIELGEVETAISNYGAVKETVVLLKNEHEVNNQKLVAYLTANQGFEPSVSELREYLEVSLPAYMIPSHFVFLDKMPLTTNGKFDRKALPEPAADRPSLSNQYEPPVSPVEKEITGLWEQLLDISPIGRHDKFFELGGTSIQAARFIGQMMEKLDTSIFITTIFDYPTVAAYATFISETYPDYLRNKNAIVVSQAEGKDESPFQLLTAEQIAEFPKFVPTHLNPSKSKGEVSQEAQPTDASPAPQQPIFILAPPRSGTTLLRVMLAGHPELFACNELQLLHFETLADRSKAYTGKFNLWTEGLIRAVMELENLTAAQAKSLLYAYEKKGMTTSGMINHLKTWANDRTIVDKSPSYLLDPLALEKAIRDFPNARFIHLVRHPYSMVKSFEKYHMDQVLYLKEHGHSAQALGELVWLHSHQNAVDFLQKIPARQRHFLRYEDLVKYPEREMQELCYEIGLPYHPNLVKPYLGLDKKMTDGLHTDSRSMGDTHFDQKDKIEASKADDWKGVLDDNFLSDNSWNLAERFGYEKIDRPQTAAKRRSEHNLDETKFHSETQEFKHQPPTTSDIAIIGMACRFPGADNIDEFWDNLVHAKDVSRTVTDADLEEEGIEIPESEVYVRKTYSLDNPYGFDAPFFGFHKREAELTDPQHRHFLETAYEALEQAGYDPFRYVGKIGVFGGVAKNTYFQNNVLTNPEVLKAAGKYQEMIAAESTFSVSRVAYKLNLRGPAVNVQTACSTGGTAIHLACQSIRSGDCDMVIVGGGRVQAPVNGGHEYVEGGPLSSDGILRAFDENANGMVQGNGMGMLVLKRLDQAQADGDHIWAVIKSSAINNDGSDKTGLTAPSSQGQADCIAEAIEKAGIVASQISYFETHGTGTFIGDPIEIQGLANAVSRSASPGKIPIGSVKTNIGHLDAGACIAGMIKTVLALKNEMLPPSMHFKKANPQLNLDQTPFYVLQEVQPWLTGHELRRAGVSSFGLGGTNAHIVLEEAPLNHNSGGTRPGFISGSSDFAPNPLRDRQLWGKEQLMVVSAKTDDALLALENRITDFIKNKPSLDLSNAAKTLAVGRPRFTKRKALLIDKKGQVKTIAHQQIPTNDQQFIWMFPGGGAQYENMARDLYRSNAFFKKQIDDCFEILKEKCEIDISKIVFPKQPKTKLSEAKSHSDTSGNQGPNITDPSFALASLFTFEYALAKLWQHWGVQPAAMIGHSMGEYTAACLAGVMSVEDALMLVTVRGKLFESLDGDGCMLGVAQTEAALKPLLDDDHTISVINKKDSLVVSSTKNGIARLKNNLDKEGIDNALIHITVPAHSPLIDPILDEFRKHLSNVDFQPPVIPFISNVTGTWITDEEATDPNYWISHIRQTVRFADGLETLFNPTQNSQRATQNFLKKRIFLEVGPGQTLSSFARAVPTLSGEKPLIVASVRHPKEMVSDVAFILKTVGKLWTNGVDIDWENFYEGIHFQRVPLPNYPFEKKKYFIKPATLEARQPDYSAAGLIETKLETTSSTIEENSESTLEPTMHHESRIPILVKEIQLSLQELSGMEPADMYPEDTFLELGFDSLFLSQAVIKFNYKFKLKLSFRQLFEEAPTIAALAEWIDQEIPEDQFRPAPKIPVPQTAPPAQEVKQATTVSQGQQMSAPAANSSQLETLIQQQLTIMQQQLELLKAGQQTGTSDLPYFQNLVNLPEDKKEAKSGKDSPKPEKMATLDEPESSIITRSKKGVTAKMSNYKKVSGGKNLTEQQKHALKEFMLAYNRMTQRSKELAQRHRQVYADPRSTTGFSKLWKEICYQIAHEKSKGSKIWDVDGNEYIDYVMSYGVALFGHMPDFVENAVIEAVRKGNSIDLLPEQATEIARIICELTGYDRVTLANTGTEAVLGAVRAARTATGKDRIAVFDTDYHGMIDQFMVRGIHLKGKSKTLPASPGIPNFMVENTLTLDYDDPEVLQKLENEISELAAVVIEPVQAQNPHWQHRELVQQIRQLTKKHDVALIFDEIINGFRMHQRGAQGWYGVDADISAYGKSVSGGLPMSAVAGKAKYMDAFDGGVWNYGDDTSPDGVISYFASTFIKNPISVAAGYAAIKEIERLGPALQNDLNEKTVRFAERIKAIFLKTKAPFMIQSASSFFMIKYADGNPLSKLFNYYLRTHGVNVRERPCFISTAHTDADFEKTYRGFELAIADMFAAGLIQPYEGEDLNVIVPTTVESGGRKKQSEYPVTVPLTEGQQEIFLSDQILPAASKAYNIATEIRLEGEELDVDRMKTSLQALVIRHEALRTLINEGGKTQTVQGELEIEIPVIDLRSGSTAEIDVAVEQLHNEEAEHLFDLQKGPLVRFKIVLLERHVSLVFIHVHHIICDGWSLGILTRELGQIYSDLGQRTNLPDFQNLANLPTPKPISHYAQEQADLPKSYIYQTTENYWLNEFADLVPVLNLPTDFPRPPMKSFSGAVEKISFDEGFVAQIRKTAARQGTTFYVFMLAAYQAFLSRITGQEDFVIGVAAAGHNLPGNQNLVGHAIGLLPVRTNVDTDISFKDYVKKVRGKILDAFDNQQFTYGSLVKNLKVERSANRNTLVSVAFNLDSPLDDLFFGKMKASTRAIPRHYETFDSFINLKPLGKTVDFEWNFSTDLFRRKTIQSRLKEFKQFLQSILVEVEKPIAGLRLLPDFESQQIIAFGQGEQIDFPLHLCLHELFVHQAEKTPDKKAVQITNGGHLTYRQLNERAAEIAVELNEKGVRTGDFIGLCMERSLEMVASIYGILKAGAAYVPIDPRNPQERVRFILEDAGCEVVVADKRTAAGLSFYEGKTIITADVNRSRLNQKDKERLEPSTKHQAPKTNNPAYIIYTSGSTGNPKGVVIRHENAVNTLFAINRHLKISGEGTVYSVSSMSFDMSIPDYFLTLMMGATLVLADEKTKKDGFALKASLEKFQPTHMQATPTTWQILMLSGWKGNENMTAVAGGEGFPKELAAQMANDCKQVFNGYGPTETTIYATYQEVTAENLTKCTGEFVAIGSPIANTRMHILDSNCQPVPIGVPGELFIGGNGVSNGYLKRPNLTAKKFISPKPKTKNPKPKTKNQKLYRTGDLVKYLPTGEIEFLGRIDDQVKIRGFRIELGEIEEVMKRFPSVNQGVVNIFKDATGSPQLAGYVVWQEEADNEGLKLFLKGKLPGYMVPAIFVEMEKLPMNTSLKVNRKALPKPDLSRLSSAQKEAPTTKGEVLLSGIWKELLGVSEVSVQDDFFELGGHSLAAVQLMARIQDATGKKLPLTTLFQHSTIKKLAGQLNGYNKAVQTHPAQNDPEKPEYSSLICIRKGGDKTPLYLVHGGGLHVLFYQNLVKYLDDDQPIYALQAKGLNDGEEPLETIEEMAAHYIREIKSENPDGPYCLAGYSLGGLIAWEMAAQLQAEHREVPLLALFDAVAKYEWAGNGNGGSLKKKFKKLGYNMSLLLKDPARAIEYKTSVLKMQFQHMKGKLTMAYRNNKTNEIEEGYIPYGKKVYEKSLQAYDKYILKPLQIHADLFKAKEQMFYLHDPVNYGWDQFALHGLTIHQIEGNHLTLFDEPHGRQVAEALKRRLLEIRKLEIGN
ncbi:MAG: amino acid adenylation domain-containing protein [Bacteroidota bacterium]